MRMHPASLAALAAFLGAVSCTPLPLAPVDTAGGTKNGAKDQVTPSTSKGTDPSAPQLQDGIANKSVIDITGLKVASVSVVPTDATLSVPPENPGLASAGFPTSLQLDARVTLENGYLLDGDFVWVSSNPELVAVDSKGLVSTVRTTGGAKPTLVPVTLKGTSRKDPSKSVTVTLHITDDATAIVQLQ